MNIQWEARRPTKCGYHRGVYRGVAILAVVDKSNGCRVEYLGRTMRATSHRNMREALASLADLLRCMRDCIDKAVTS